MGQAILEPMLRILKTSIGRNFPQYIKLIQILKIPKKNTLSTFTSSIKILLFAELSPTSTLISQKKQLKLVEALA